jgi:hypothetical protein
LNCFREFQDAQQTKGEFAYFSLLFFVPDIRCAQHVTSTFPGEMILGLLTASVEGNHQPLGIIGIPTLKALRGGEAPYVKRFVEDDWATGYIDSSVKNCVWLIENNPPLQREKVLPQ